MNALKCITNVTFRNKGNQLTFKWNFWELFEYMLSELNKAGICFELNYASICCELN